MKKQYIKLGCLAIVLIVCVAGYFLISNYYDEKEEQEKNANNIVAFSLDDYKAAKAITYTYNSNTVNLVQKDDKWMIDGDSETDLDESKVETEMLAALVEIVAEEKIGATTDLEGYGFVQDDDTISASTNIITITDSNDEKHTIYIGNANPYDSSKYYMMVEGDENVYVVDSSLVDSFAKSTDDLVKEEETTIEETATEE